MAVSDLNYHSYFSLFTGASATATASEFNVFDEDNYSSYSSTAVSSPDITYDSSTGKIHFGAAGDYFVVFTANVETGVNAKHAVLKIKKNGTALITSDEIRMMAAFDPEQATVHLVVSIEAGDYLECTHEGDDASCFVSAGTHVTILRTRGHYSSAFYTTKADQTSTADNYDLFDTTNEGGVVSSKVNGITYTGSNGRFTPSATKRFLLFSTWIYDTGGNVNDLQHKLAIDGSAIDDATAGASAALTPVTHTYSLIKEVADDEYASVKRDQGGTTSFDAEIGTSFSMIDVSNNGVDPSAMLCFSVTSDSSALANDSGDKDIFDEDNYGTFAKTDHVTASGINYTEADGKFTVAEAGKYLVICNLVADSVSTNASTDFKITINGSAYFTDKFRKQGTDDPRTHVVCLVISLAKDDYLNFIVNNFGADVDDGTSVSIFRVDNVAGSGDLVLDRTAPAKEIGQDYTINTLNRDVVGSQHTNTTDRVLPFSLGQKGPRHLRGRTTSYSTSLGSKKRK
mgnify:FL=1